MSKNVPTKYNFVNRHKLRTLYGRSDFGERNRESIRLSVTPETMEILKLFVNFGKGGYGSPFIELATRILCVLMSEGQDLELVANELNSAVSSPFLRNNLISLARFVGAYSEDAKK